MATASGNEGGEYLRVARALRTAMSDGTYGVGSSLPPQRVLATRFNVSRDTVQRALRELTSEGWIEARQGSGTRVVQVQRVHSAVSGMGVLRALIDEAFRAEEVTLDAFSLTAETLSGYLNEQVARVHEGEISPRRITVRLLLPAEDVDMPYPRSKGGPEDKRLTTTLHEMSRVSSELIRGILLGLRRERLVQEVEVEIRRVPLTPHAKLYILNGTVALQAFYEVIERTKEMDAGEELDAIDVVGLQAPLFEYVKDRDPTSHGSRFVEVSQRWFDSVWELLAVPPAHA
ncbi:GntR family transcriptional regulator [Streptomyces sp. NPDC087440]|uniref:GntR family transcriptional regulator n=1 Tax=Streptomyces sp. NPDC087440 TaxID=3365790 RepID=UPI0038257D24